MRAFWLIVPLVALSLVMPEGKSADWYIPTTPQALDSRIPLLKVQHASGRRSRGSAVLIGMDDEKAWYITNHHMTPGGSSAKYTLVTANHSYEAVFVKHDRYLDLGLLIAARPLEDISPLLVAARPPPNGSVAGIHGWTHGKTFSYQIGRVTREGNGWTTVSVGANQGQSGGAFIHKGQVIGITSNTTQRVTNGASVYGIRKFLKWPIERE